MKIYRVFLAAVPFLFVSASGVEPDAAMTPNIEGKRIANEH